MNVKYINPFIQASKTIIQQIIGKSLEVEKPFLKNGSYTSKNMIIMIGLTGEINGQVLISFDKKSSINIASRMMGGIEMTELDEIGKSAVSELCNMIMGTVSTIFSTQEIKVNITPPIQLHGSKMAVSHNCPAICIPLRIYSDAKMELNIAVE